MIALERLGLPLLHRIEPERAHRFALTALRCGLVHGKGPVTSPRLATPLAGLHLPNPVGLAAGFDKNAEAIAPLMMSGFGFLEVGAATPRPQPGNPKPRLFRLSEDRAIINRFGFNNDGAEAIAARLAAKPEGIPTGLNLGANKDSADRAADFAKVLEICGDHVDFVTVNVSSPNTEKLRDLQGTAALAALLGGVLSARGERTLPVFLKIAPDLDEAGLEGIAEVALASGIDGVIATNTTLDRSGLTSRHAREAGGLSGHPLFARSTTVLRRLYGLTGGKIPLIGVGGIASAQDAYEKILAGASAVQLYSALVYSGLSLAGDIARGLDKLLEKDGVGHISQATGQEGKRS